MVEPHVVEVLQQRDDRPGEGARRPANRVPDPHHLSEVGDPAGELLLFGAHAGRIAGGLRRLVVMRARDFTTARASNNAATAIT